MREYQLSNNFVFGPMMRLTQILHVFTYFHYFTKLLLALAILPHHLQTLIKR